MSQALIDLLKHHQDSFSPVTPFDLNKEKLVFFDLTSQNDELAKLDLNDEEIFNNYIFGKLQDDGANVGIGRYNEDREIYKRSDMFAGKNVRSVHLGIDIWAEAGTAVYAPLKGKIHSFKNNTTHGDYGPTIIMQHQLEGITFYTLYGHLSIRSLGDKSIGQQIERGEKIADFGDYSVNVHWPPHLHFQIISDIGDKFGDFPGVAAKAERKKYLELCPDPNLILGINDYSQ